MALARNQTSAFGGAPQVRYLMPVCTRAAFYVWISFALFVGGVRSNETGTASLILLPYGYRNSTATRRTVWVLLVALTGFVGAAAVAAMIPLLFLLVCLGSLSAGAFSAVSLYRLWKASSAMRRLRTAHPEEPYWLVSSMASVQSGAGAELLREVVAESDSKGWILVLEAANSGLVDYYARFGFVVAAEAERMPWSEFGPGGPMPCFVTCMTRTPSTVTHVKGTR